MSVGRAEAAGATAKAPPPALFLALTLVSLYVSQGLIAGFTFGAVPALLRDQGMPVEQIGLMALALLPWAFSFVVAPVVDRYKLPGRTHRRSWIIPMQLLLPPAVLLLALHFTASHFATIMALTFAVGLLAAVSDVAAHGLAVEQLSPEQRSWGNGLQVGGYWVGSLLSGGVVLMLQPLIGTFNAIALVALALLPILVPITLYPEGTARPRAALERHRPGVRHFLRRPGAGPMLLLILLLDLGRAAAMGMQGPFLVDAGFDLTEIGFLRGTIGVAAGLLGSIVGSALAARLKRDRALSLTATLQALAFGAYAYVVVTGYHPFWLLGAIFAFEYFAFSATIVALYAFIMDNCSPEQAGTDFTLQYCFGNFVVIAGGALSGFGVAAFGYAWHFILCFAVCATAAAVTPILYRRIMEALGVETAPAPVPQEIQRIR